MTTLLSVQQHDDWIAHSWCRFLGFRRPHVQASVDLGSKRCTTLGDDLAQSNAGHPVEMLTGSRLGETLEADA
jgi:hypothetical protein